MMPMLTTLFRRARMAICLLPPLLAMLVAGHEASAGGAHHLLQALEPPREVAPRAVTMTENFELVAVVDRGRMLVFLDNAVTNAAVEGAAVELDVDGEIVGLTEIAPGIYSTGTWLPRAGVTALMFSVIAGDVDDLLVADIRLEGEAAVAASAPVEANVTPWRQMIDDTGRVVAMVLVGGGLLMALSLVFAGMSLPAPLSRWADAMRLPAIMRRRRD